MHMIRHYAILIQLDNGVFFRQSLDSILNYISKRRALDISAAWESGRDFGIAFYRAEVLACLGFA